MKILTVIAAVLLLLMVAGCTAVVPPEEDPLYLKITEFDGRLLRAEKLIDNQGLMNLLLQLESLQKDVQSLRNDVETMQHQLDQSNTRQRDLYLDVDQRLQQIEQMTVAGNSAGMPAGGVLEPGQLPLPGGTDRANYQAAFELLKQGRYEQATLAWQQFMVAFPISELSDNAQYWLAEINYVSQDYEAALPAFQLVIDRYPDSRKIADALLKIGYCNYELGQNAPAQQALSEVVERFPETTAARLASQRLDRMKREQR
ncbi:MAG TPA: tol-pal system protein YbgF [Gammaproteobacteria bacterium]|nr:tol-pal system protein YbgF [Gammaproteobacteria bacterium]MDP7152800.1 tol-pal system protein YbgF [Gammaproteobacteria bacterium]MDP7297047.1 tol-pal system protein YbgF [Gammaproteobacteria bacterium]MDP7660871.1 tol-pal system protein YbgF [Gammaproteobacteria bacterium]HJP39803.1 tol-pal system protein YbgF [Gammaproteobacteria bacterium]